MNRDRLAQLQQLAAMIRDRELHRLAELAAKRHFAEAQVKGNRKDRLRTLSSAAADPAHIAGADGPWLRWNAKRQRDLGSDAARAAADAEAQIVNARRAFGRAEALGRLATRGRGGGKT